MKRLVLAGILLSLALSPAADAKSCIRIQAPASAERGDTIRVVVRVYLPTWRNGKVVGLKPLPSWAGRIELTVTAPGGSVRRIRTTGAEDGVGVARIALPAVGRWKFAAVGWEYAPPTCAPPRFVRVG